jgi:hypothetical protein
MTRLPYYPYAEERVFRGPSKTHAPHASGFSDLFTVSAKTLKSDRRFPNWMNAVIYLAPGIAADQYLQAKGQLHPGERFVGDLCPGKTSHPPARAGQPWGGCFGQHGENCIFTTGLLAVPPSQLAMIMRTLFWKRYPREFKALLYHDIELLQRYAALKAPGPGGQLGGRRLAVRINGTSDIRWERVLPEVFSDFPEVAFYDYTKLSVRFLPRHGIEPAPLPPNYSLTFSYSGDNAAEAEAVLKRGGNVAMVFDIRPTIGKIHMAPMVTRASLPGSRYSYPVVDGDLHDLRFMDPHGVIVGLRAKGALRKEVATGDSEFVRYVRDLPEYATGALRFHSPDTLYPYGPNPYLGPSGELLGPSELAKLDERVSAGPSSSLVQIGAARGGSGTVSARDTGSSPSAKDTLQMADIEAALRGL